MPNLRPPVVTVEQAVAYRERILAALREVAPDDPACAAFEPLMTLYLTDRTPPDEIRRAKDSGVVHAVKLYPAGATTNSDAGVTSLSKVSATLEAMQRLDVPLLIHGEVVDAHVDVFDREKVFIDEKLIPLRRDFPALRVVFEHVTTREAAEYVAGAEADRRDDHAAAPALRPQRALQGRDPPALVLPAGAQARDAPDGAGGGGDLRQSALLPRHRQRARTRAARRRWPAAAPAATPRRTRWSCTPPRSSRPVRSTGSRGSRACTAPTSTGCRAMPAASRCGARLDGARVAALRRRDDRAARRRRVAVLALAA
jgi:hypothetical protein